MRRSVKSTAMWGRWVTRVVCGLTAFLVIVFLVAWLWFRADAKSWAWWDPPAVLSIGGRHFDRDAIKPVTLAEAKSRGTGIWKKVQIEWPMQWPIWASTYQGISPTVAFLCTSAARCLPYDLQGGP